MASNNKVQCNFCNRMASKSNYNRHAKTFHLLCPNCLSLESRSRHKCFGAQLISKSKIFTRLNKTSEYEGGVTSTGIFIPMEMRGDCLAAMLRCLAARQLLDTDIWTPALFLLAILRRGCIACMAANDGAESLREFHNCRLQAGDILNVYGDLSCMLFNIEYDDKAQFFLRRFLEDNSFD